MKISDAQMIEHGALLGIHTNSYISISAKLTYTISFIGGELHCAGLWLVIGGTTLGQSQVKGKEKTLRL